MRVFFYKLIRAGVSTKFYNVIRAMYANTWLTVQAGDKMSPLFRSKVGVRQGDNLSPTLFNLFINDLPSIFDETCKPAQFGGMSLQSLLFADDLIIFSESVQGLQEAMNRLSAYCGKWGLTVSDTKSKFMCVGPPKNLVGGHSILYNGAPVEQVSSYRYLGTLFDDAGNMKTARQDVCNRAMKVFFKLIRALHPLPKVSTSLHLFDRLIAPILSYGNVIWSPSNLTTKMPDLTGDPKSDFYKSLRRDFLIISRVYERDNPGEKLHLKFMKLILGVHQKASNLAVYGELGRYPTFISDIMQCLKYSDYLASQENNPLLRAFYTNMVEYETSVKKGCVLGFAEAIRNYMNLNDRKLSPSMLGRVKKHLQNEFENYWRHLVQSPFLKHARTVGTN